MQFPSSNLKNRRPSRSGKLLRMDGADRVVEGRVAQDSVRPASGLWAKRCREAQGRKDVLSGFPLRLLRPLGPDVHGRCTLARCSSDRPPQPADSGLLVDGKLQRQSGGNCNCKVEGSWFLLIRVCVGYSAVLCCTQLKIRSRHSLTLGGSLQTNVDNETVGCCSSGAGRIRISGRFPPLLSPCLVRHSAVTRLSWSDRGRLDGSCVLVVMVATWLAVSQFQLSPSDMRPAIAQRVIAGPQAARERQTDRCFGRCNSRSLSHFTRPPSFAIWLVRGICDRILRNTPVGWANEWMDGLDTSVRARRMRVLDAEPDAIIPDGRVDSAEITTAPCANTRCMHAYAPVQAMLDRDHCRGMVCIHDSPR